MKFHFLAVSLLVSTLLSGCGSSPSTSHLSVPKLIVALKPDKNPDTMIAEKATLEAFLSSELKIPVEVIVPLSAAVIEEGLANGSIDLAYLSASGMLKAYDRKTADLLLAGEIDGKTSYTSYWLILKEKTYSTVSDLRGKPIAFSGKTSTSGYLIPHADLIKKGLLQPKENPEAFFGPGNVFYGTGYVSAVEQVLSGKAEAAAVSYYVLDKDKHLSLEQRSLLKVLASQGPVPTHTIAIRSALTTQDRQLILAALEKLNLPENEMLRDKVFTSKLVAVDTETHLAPLREALELTGASN
jgi:phosphonate transport system substrate-binding protein